jgi:hypothetical protein
MFCKSGNTGFSGNAGGVPVRMAAAVLLAGVFLPSAASAEPAYHCFFADTNLGYILDPGAGTVIVWGGIVPQLLQARNVVINEGDAMMRATATTTITSANPAPDFLPLDVTENFVLNGPSPAVLSVTTLWSKTDGTAFPDYFEPTDFAPEPFVPGLWVMPCVRVGPVESGN